jgi:hypothetical protein
MAGPTAKIEDLRAEARENWAFTPEGRKASRLLLSTNPEERAQGEALEKAFEARLAERYKSVPTPAEARQSVETRTGGGTPPYVPKPEIGNVKNASPGSSVGNLTSKGWEIKDKSGKVYGHVPARPAAATSPADPTAPAAPSVSPNIDALLKKYNDGNN